jgi:hypothetical protein
MAAAPAAAVAAPFRKPRRFTTSFLDLDTAVLLNDERHYRTEVLRLGQP